MTKVIVFGCNGHMGKEVVSAINERDDVTIVAGVDKVVDKDSSFPQFQAVEDFMGKADVIIDFSHHTACQSVLTYALKAHIPVVLATTGYTNEELELIKKMSEHVAIFQSANMSVGINLMRILSQVATTVLQGYDIEITEKHHNRKLDAPSGTAMLLMSAIKAVNPELYPVTDRTGANQPRQKNEVGMTAIRGGNIVGEHEVFFIGGDEIFSIKHVANSRSIFAKGAVDASVFMANKEPRLYTMSDMMQV